MEIVHPVDMSYMYSSKLLFFKSEFQQFVVNPGKAVSSIRRYYLRAGTQQHQRFCPFPCRNLLERELQGIHNVFIALVSFK